MHVPPFDGGRALIAASSDGRLSVSGWSVCAVLMPENETMATRAVPPVCSEYRLTRSVSKYDIASSTVAGFSELSKAMTTSWNAPHDAGGVGGGPQSAAARGRDRKRRRRATAAEIIDRECSALRKEGACD